MNQQVYLERQWMKVIWLTLPLITLFILFIETNEMDMAQRLQALGLLALVNVGVLLCFGRLSIVLQDNLLSWHFGLFGWPRWKLPLSEIRHVEVCQSRWTEGWGIRMTKEGMLYNASGSTALRITKADGSTIRLGTQQPEILLAQLQQSLNLTA